LTIDDGEHATLAPQWTGGPAYTLFHYDDVETLHDVEVHLLYHAPPTSTPEQRLYFVSHGHTEVLVLRETTGGTDYFMTADVNGEPWHAETFEAQWTSPGTVIGIQGYDVDQSQGFQPYTYIALAAGEFYGGTPDTLNWGIFQEVSQTGVRSLLADSSYAGLLSFSETEVEGHFAFFGRSTNPPDSVTVTNGRFRMPLSAGRNSRLQVRSQHTQ